MIVLGDEFVPSAAQKELIDFGFVQRPATGAAVTRIDRPGSRWRAAFTFPPMQADRARVLIRRLTAARREGLRLRWPLNGVNQGEPGVPVVDGAVTGGATLALRGVTPGYVAKEGYWLSVIDAAGARYLHQVAGTVAADAAGEVTLSVQPLLRCALADGAAVLLAAPEMEGLPEEVPQWNDAPGGIVTGLAVTLEESA